jgi:hypothetical protein
MGLSRSVGAVVATASARNDGLGAQAKVATASRRQPCESSWMKTTVDIERGKRIGDGAQLSRSERCSLLDLAALGIAHPTVGGRLGAATGLGFKMCGVGRNSGSEPILIALSHKDPLVDELAHELRRTTPATTSFELSSNHAGGPKY